MGILSIVVVFIGLVAGILSGMLGIGGATVVIPGLVYLVGLDQKTAQGTSLALLMIPVVFTAFINYYRAGFFHKEYALLLILVFPIGAYVGSLLALSLDSSILRRIFGIFLIFIAIKMIFSR
ncbi:MAG: sulfite exporter TauE/SafE family protein [Candidatus Calescibacterium sp.]|nr:sulfite exporter TauE/SafE family protein [Candidatus Calescibacterium sp.]MDW8133128.1 sulfite exporter TauE/SafE family protein [Candidatus Calescibacterium sp.]